MKKIRIKQLKIDQLTAFRDAMRVATQNSNLIQGYTDKLILACGMELYISLVKKCVMPNVKTTICLKIHQACAVVLLCNPLIDREGGIGDYEKNVMRTIITTIDKNMHSTPQIQAA